MNTVVNSNDVCELLEHKHRKEKKELQAHIMALKKQIKGDRTKKKDITAEIFRLECELQERHVAELKEQLVNLEEKDGALSEEVVELRTDKMVFEKISKAQKRRDKKAREDIERNERIKQQEKDNLQGPRTLETLEITSKLKDIHLKMHLIPSDGDCLYKAISHQLETTGRKVMQVDDLRKATSNYIRDNKEEFIPFMTNPETFEMLTEVEFNEYCNAITDTKTWGGQIELRALSNVLKCPIHVVQGAGQDTVKQGDEVEGTPLVITYHRYMYGLGAHYNSSVKIVD